MRARLIGIEEEFKTYKVTFEISKADFEKIPEGDISLTIDKFRYSRSLNANNYYQRLIKDIAKIIDSSRAEVNNLMLSRYGEYKTDDDGNYTYQLGPDNEDYLKDDSVHLMPTGNVVGGERVYLVLKGSSELNSREFVKLLSGTVSEARELGIDTLDEIEIQRWLNERKN